MSCKAPPEGSMLICVYCNIGYADIVKKCTRCLVAKEITEFHCNKVKRDGLSPHCKDCQKKYLKDHYNKNKSYYKAKARKRAKICKNTLRELKSSPCTDCGQSYPPYVMDFDHVNGIKERNISSIADGSTKMLREEIAKCELVCANCHRIRTFKRISKRL